MGWDLEPIKPHKTKHPKDPCDGQPIWGHYNLAGWGWLQCNLEKWGVDTSEFSYTNDGEVLSAEICEDVANALQEHLEEFDSDTQVWIAPHIPRWRYCGGYRQF